MKIILLPAAIAATFALPAFACSSVQIHDAYARASTAMSQSGAAFMEITNPGSTDCRLVGANSDVAERVELHTHIEDDTGVMRMVEVEEGFAIPADSRYHLARGGDHIMFLGLTRTLAHGDEIDIDLVFEDGTTISTTIPVDLERMPEHGHSHSHSHN
ncbi:MAG: copper chaperone PCu(A)C [Natronohydrobacter sp.]|nr:copper chaperone PCu(A)C [Natronohydrobacter sp.]